MADVNTRIQTLLLRRAVARTRYENALLRALRPLLTQAALQTRQIVRALTPSPARTSVAAGLGDPGRLWTPAPGAQVAQAMAQIHAVWERTVHALGRELEPSLVAFGELDLLEVPQEINSVLDGAQPPPRGMQEAVEDLPPSARATFSSVPQGQVARLLAGPLGGALFQSAFADLGSRLLLRVRSILTAGLTRGQSVPVLSRLVQSAMGNARWEAERIVRSEFVRVAGEAALIQFQQNAALLSGVQWVATLDQRTCLQCGALDGRVWANIRQARVPVTSTHPNCRCVLVPVVRSSRSLNLPPSTRASFTGQVPETLAYPQWFRQQDAAFQRAVLGPTRYGLYRSNRLRLGDFATAAGTRTVQSALALARRRRSG